MLYMMIIVYAIKSKTKNYIYVWMTDNLERRLKEHNTWKQKSTKAYVPYEVIYTEVCNDRISARIREKYWKSWTGKEKLRML